MVFGIILNTFKTSILRRNSLLIKRGGGLAALRRAIGRRAFARPGNDRGTTRPQLVVEGLFSRLLAEGLATASGDALQPGDAASAHVGVLSRVAERARALVTRT